MSETTSWDPSDFLQLQMQRMAAHLLMLQPDETFLKDLARPLVEGALDDREELAGVLRSLVDDLGPFLSLPEQAELPIVRLARSFDLSMIDLDLVLFSLLPEMDDRFGSVFQALRGAASHRRPTLGMALRALVPPEARWEVRKSVRGSNLWAAGLLLEEDGDLPFPDRSLRPMPALLDTLEGRVPTRILDDVPVRRAPAEDSTLSRTLEWSPTLADCAGDMARWLGDVGHALVHLPCVDLDRSRLLGSAIAARMDRRLIQVGPVARDVSRGFREAVVLATLEGAVLYFELAPEISGFCLGEESAPAVPIVLATSTDCVPEVPPRMSTRRAPPPIPRPIEQARIWEGILGEAGGVARIDVLANQTRLLVPEIERIVALAAQRAKLNGGGAVEHRDVACVLREVVRDPAPALSRTYRPNVSWSRLVLSPSSIAKLEGLVRRVQHRVTVQDRWGMSSDDGRGNGLVALFYGEPGTGKTLAAEAVATQLDLPLVTVDLSRVVSKYLGETEKNLADIFEQTEGYRGVLFFDEADALFGKRTGVKDAHDRYANLETSFLLLRLEAFEGMAILATNLRQNMDDAFTRRLQFIIHFPRPTSAQRRLIWQHHLPEEPLDDAVDLNELMRFDLVGGEIRNASLSAAYEAAARSTQISQELLLEPCRQELAKRGEPEPGS